MVFLFAHALITIGICSVPIAALLNVPMIEIYPSEIKQGEPAIIRVVNIRDGVTVESLKIDGKELPIFSFGNGMAALVGIDLNSEIGDKEIQMMLSDRRLFKPKATVIERRKEKAPLGIPEKLGGNTKSSQAALVSSLESENTLLAKLPSESNAQWMESFEWPLSSTTITDEYGYSRETGEYEIAHKGTDFRAATGTPVMAMNSGKVVLSRDLRVYGKTVVIDHGLGLKTFYMHLSKRLVDEGEFVSKSHIIALSGDSGYAERPHLHISVRIDTASIDPVKFLALFMRK